MVKTRRTLKEVNQEQEVMILNHVELALMWCMRVSCLWLSVIVLMRSCTAAMSRRSVGKHSIPTRVEIHFHISKNESFAQVCRVPQPVAYPRSALHSGLRAGRSQPLELPKRAMTS